MMMLIPLITFGISLFILAVGLPYIKVITAKNVGGRRVYCVRVGYSHIVTDDGRYWEYIW